jgi:hypothetical protein
MIIVKGKKHSWLVYSIAGDPVTDEVLELKMNDINNIPVKAYILGGFLESETTFEKLDELLSSLREIGMTPGDFGVLIDIENSQVLLLPEDDTMEADTTEEGSIDVIID